MTILVGGEPVGTGNAVSDTETLLFELLEHPVLVESANALKRVELHTVKPPYPSGNEDFEGRVDEGVADIDSPSDPKYVYVFQKEFAAVSPVFAEFVGTDEITTCIGLVIRDPSSGLTSIGHFDDPKCVVNGVNELLNSVASASGEAFQVHMVGAFDDSSEYFDQTPLTQQLRSTGEEATKEVTRRRPGWSWPLALRMIEILHSSTFDFEVETCCLLRHNTSIGHNGHPFPTVRGFVVETSSGRLMASNFLPASRGPDGTVRGVCTATVYSNPKWIRTLISPYETISDTFVIRPFQWNSEIVQYAKYMLTLSDTKFLETFSTSPHAEDHDFLPNSRRIFTYISKFPNWEQTFPTPEPRVWARTGTGGWIRK